MPTPHTTATAATESSALEVHRADGVFEGGGVKGIAFAGAVAAARDEIGVREWVNVAGTSAGAIAAALLAAGYSADKLRKVLSMDYRRFADYGRGGILIGGLRNAISYRGLARGKYFRQWLGHCFEDSSLGDPDPPFSALVRDDLPADLPPDQAERARYRLRVIASDVTGGRMLVLPDDITEYQDERGRPYTKDDFKVIDAVRMSMSFPYFFEPVTLYRKGREHVIVDGGLLSNFPVWLFDSPGPIRRKTWGFRLHTGAGPEEEPDHEIHRSRWPIHLTRALVESMMGAWDQYWRSRSTQVRTVSIPTGKVQTLDFHLTLEERDYLYESGLESATRFFRSQPDYVNVHGQRAEPSPLPRG
jgi:NTE family protein